MDGAENIFTILVSALTLLFFCYLIYGFFSFFRRRSPDAFDGYLFSFSGIGGSQKKGIEKCLLGHFPYYDKLSADARTKFLVRVEKFVSAKSFEGRGEMQVTDEMKVMIASSAVQLTFGLEKYVLDHFSRIIIYPESYYSPLTHQYHMGEANPVGVIVISWKDLLKGNEIPDDTYNVGLHEMAHALELEKILGGDYDFYFTSYYEKWKQVTEEEYEKVRDTDESFLRDYAGTNRHEFFSVCIEHFFEATTQFKARLPQVYYHLCILLNQDPLNANNKIANHNQSLEKRNAKFSTASELFSTRYSMVSMLTRPALIVLVLAFQAFYTSSLNLPLLPTGLGMVVIFAVPAFFIFNKIVLCEKYIGIRNIFGTLIAAYPLDDIVSVSFDEEPYGDSMKILLLGNGIIYKNNYFYKAMQEDVVMLKKLLIEKEVVVK